METVTNLKTKAENFFQELQDEICRKLAAVNRKESFKEDSWTHNNGGGGKTRILQNGAIFEKAGVNFSAVTSALTEKLASRLSVKPQKNFATGISLVVHPLSPMIPTVHMNLRYLELANGDAWFGGGADLTPYYLFEGDAKHFHQTLKSACDKHNPTSYPRFKRQCDEYFFIKHRGEARGIGGIFFDYLRGDPEKHFALVQRAGGAFLESYVPIVQSRMGEIWGECERAWQLLRRGRYVEFNLLYDRGTLFGLETQGRMESILMSLPPLVRWEYDVQVEEGSREARLVELLRHPRAWVDG